MAENQRTYVIYLDIKRERPHQFGKIATILRGGMFPMAYVYPRDMRATRDLLRRREYFVHHQAELFTHIENTNFQYNYNSTLTKGRMRSATYRATLPERFGDPVAQKNIQADMFLASAFHRLILDLEAEIQRQAQTHDPFSLALLAICQHR